MRSPKIAFNNLILGCVLFLLHIHYTYGQNTVSANAIISEASVNLSSNAIDSDRLTKADLMASSGTALGIGAYEGHLEVQFPSLLEANTTSFLKFRTEENLLQPLLGGNLGHLLSDVLGVLLLGNQNFSVTAKNGNNSVLFKDSGIPNDFGSDNLRVVIDKNNDYFLAIAPENAYNRVRLNNSIGSLLGFNSTRRLEMYEAFYPTAKTSGGLPTYTSYSGTGLTLDLLSITGTGVTNPHLAIDGNPDTLSELSLGVLGVAASIEQTAFFDTPSDADDVFYIKLAVEPSLLELGLANNIRFIAQHGASTPTTTIPLSSILDVDLLGLLQNGQPATIAVKPIGTANRFTVQLSSLLNVALNQQMDLFEIFRAPEQPIMDPDSENVSICVGSSVSLVAHSESSKPVEIRWYDALVGGNLLGTTASGNLFSTPLLTADTTYYVAAAEPDETEESPRVAVEVNVVPIPVADDIEITGNQNPICSSNKVLLVPSSDIDGEFGWFFDANGTNPITDGLLNEGATYTLNESGVLHISGLNETNSPYTFYVRITEATAGCQNAAGDLKLVEINIVDSTANAVIDLDTSLSLDALTTILGGAPSTILTGSVTGNANPGDIVTLAVDGNSYDGTLDSTLNFSISVNGNDLIFDPDGILDVYLNGSLCTLTQEILIKLPDLFIDTIFQVFCASDAPLVADLQLSGSNLVLFESLEATAILALDTPLVDGGVYFAGILGIPISILSRVQINVELVDLPPPTTNSSVQTFCIGTDLTLANLQINESNIRIYDSASGGSELDTSTTLIDGDIYYVASVESECESTNRLAITVRIVDNEPITLSGTNENACLSRPYTYTTESGNQDYVWTVSGGTITEGGNTSDNFVTVSWDSLQDTNVSVSYLDISSCMTSKEYRLDVSVIECGEIMGEEFCLFVYNEFTPNNDGFNDFFEVKCIEDYSSTVEIYNRNGNTVFKTINYQNNWDGKANVSGIFNSGDHLPSGTYYYVINIPELERDLVGWLQIARE